MVNENKNKVFAAVAGAVVGAGAVLAGAIALNDKSNQKKVGKVISRAKNALKGYSDEAEDRVENGKEEVKKMAGKAIKSAELATSAAKKGVKNL